MLAYVLRRVLLAVPVLALVSVFVFLMIRLIPGDPATVLAGERASQAAIEKVRRDFDLDKPLPVQYLTYIRRLLAGDLGVSTQTHEPVSATLGRKFSNTAQLAGIALLLATGIGISAGIVSATKPYSGFDYCSMVLALFGLSMPAFWFGLLLMLLFGVKLGLLPVAGKGTFLHLVMPSLTLAASTTAVVARISRSSMLEVVQQDYMTTARAKGLSERAIVLKHALKNALIPVLTVVGLAFGTLLGGAVMTETVFAWPGMGRLLVDAILARDYPVVQGAVLLLAVLFVFMNLAVDIVYSVIDPRIRYS